MRNNIQYSLMTAALVFAAACSKVTPLVSPEEDRLLSDAFQASVETSGVKVALQSDLSLFWEAGDAVAVYNGSAASEYTAATSGATTTLNGAAIENDKTYYAFYPADKAVSFSGATVTAEIPYIQVPVKDNFPCNPMVSTTTGSDRSFAFKNICGLISFQIGKSDIYSVVVSANGGENLSGKVSVNCASAAPAATVVPGSGSSSVTLQQASGSVFAAGQYHVCVLPGTFASGITVTMFDNSGKQVQKATTGAFTLSRSKRVDISKTGAVDAGTAVANYNIANAAELVAFAKAMNEAAGTDGITARLTADIDLSNYELPQIASFEGVFDGQDYSIGNWEAATALFASNSGTIRHLIIGSSSSMVIPDNEDCAFIALANSGTIEYCTNNAPMATRATAAFSNTDARAVGAIAAVSTGTIDHCTNTGAITLQPISTTKAADSDGNRQRSAQLLGGIVGKAALGAAQAIVSNCSNSGAVTYTTTGFIGGRALMGGVLGGTPAVAAASAGSWADKVNNVSLSNCSNTGAVTYHSEDKTADGMHNFPAVGGIAGYVEGAMSSCTNGSSTDATLGKIVVEYPLLRGADESAATTYIRCSKVGGVAGLVSEALSSCTNYGAIDFTANISNGSVSELLGSVTSPCIGGVAGEGSVDQAISSCANYGKITSLNSKPNTAGSVLYVGGIIGRCYTTLTGCDNHGALEIDEQAATAVIGGIVGQTSKAISTCKNYESITFTAVPHVGGSTQVATVRVGGITAQSSVSPSECENHGNMDIDLGSTVHTAQIGGITGYASAGAYTSCSNLASYIKVKGGKWDTGNFSSVGGLCGWLAGAANAGTAAKPNRNTADLYFGTSDEPSPARLRIGGINGISTKACNHIYNEGDITVYSTAVVLMAGGLNGDLRANVVNGGNTGDVTVVNTSRTSGSDTAAAQVLCGVSLANGYSNASMSLQNVTVSGTIAVSRASGKAWPYAGVASGTLNNTLTLGASGAPFTVDGTTGVTVDGTALDGTNYNNDTYLVGFKNGKTLTQTNVAYK